MTQSPVVDEALAREYGLSAEEYAQILSRLDREPTWEELGIISVMWSEHCSYKSSRRHLKKLPTEAPWVLVGPGENAGVIDLGDGLAACFKMESHNHPSFIEPYQGAATGVGGIMRDIFTMGARPVANLNSLRFGSLDNPRMRFLVSGVVAGIGGYGNCMGVPTVGGEVAFDDSYDGNILVNAFTLGLMPSDKIFLSAAAHVGAPVIYVGSKTGRDGIHGATMASEEFGADSEAKRPRVQVGDPFTEKKVLEACLELMQKDAIIAIQDMGAAGLTCSTCEMASKGGLGIEIDVEKVPRRETGMTPYEVLLSESQERMLMVVHPDRAGVVQEIFEKWDLDVAIIGEITTTGEMVVKSGAKTVASLPVPLLVDEAPNYDRPHAPPPDLEARWVLPEIAERPMGEVLLDLLGQPTIASKRWVYEQYDWSVRAGTVHGPGAADAAVIRLSDKDMNPTAATTRGLAMTVDMNGRFVSLDPRRGALLGVLESARNLACVGAVPRATTDCLNFGNPEKSHVMWTMVEAIEGLAEGCRAVEAPIVSGNVSLYNETEGEAILPTPTIGMVGTIEDVTLSPGIAFCDAGDVIFMLGAIDDLGLGGSEYVLLETGSLSGRPAEPDVSRALAVHSACRTLVRSGLAKSAHDVAEGGLLTALAESAIAGGVGAKLSLPGGGRRIQSAFGEGASVIVVSVAAQDAGQAEAELRSSGIQFTRLGEVGGDSLEVASELDIPVRTLAARYENSLAEAIEGGAQDNSQRATEERRNG